MTTVRRGWWLLVAALLAALVAVPLGALLREAVGGGAGGVARAFGTPYVRTAVWHTVVLGVVVTAPAVAAGVALALAVERGSVRHRGRLRLLIAAPLVVPDLVLGLGWTEAYGPAGLADRLAGLALPGLYGPVGIAAVLAAHGVPLAYLAVAAGLATRAEPDLVRAARAAGASAWVALRTVTLPLLRMSIVAAAALVFVSVVNAFAIPQLLGTPAGFGTMSTVVYSDLAFAADPEAFRELTVVALAMVALALLAVGPADLWAGARPAVRTGPEAAAAGRAGRATAAVVYAYATLAVGLPLVAVALAAVTAAPGLPPVPANWTLANFDAAFAGVTGPALARTLWLAAAAAVLVPLLGAAVAGLPGRATRGPLGTAVVLAFAIPGSALAVGILIGYGRLLAGSAALILLAYLAKFWVFGHRPVQAALDRLPPDLPRAARASGAGPVTALRTVTLPPLATAAAIGGGLAFLYASHELTMSTILYGPGSETFAVVILNQRELGGVGTSAALALVQTGPVALVAAGLVRWGRR
ncbi:ABC transporter permease [Phytohabitans rumicis]|uniref:Iron ABC transporter permease n=1 Tax=Phytohabitans rumicis TaxID=1076125 RepID=A0A6V8LAI6_9ACTN|nr:ABC transporter permease subunit [Phytohabitans rumicis]GFJ94223.1 iron ABC transporter permease [Phytohabitans rumicis]